MIYVKQLEIRQIRIDRLQAPPWNPMEDSAKNVANLVDNIKEVGFTEPLMVTPLPSVDGEEWFRIISGVDRAKAAQAVGMTELPCTIAVDLDEDMQKFQVVRMNVIHKKLSVKKFIALYDEMAKKYSEAAVKAMFMFTEQAVMDSAIAAARAALPEAMKKGFDDKKKEISSEKDLQVVLTELFSRCGSQLERGYAVFTFGGQQHVYVAMSENLQTKIQQFVDRSELENRHISEIFEEALGVD